MSTPLHARRITSNPRPGITLVVAAIAALATVVVLLVAVKSSEIVLIVDPGEIVRSGYAVSKTISNSAAAIALGTAFLLATAVPVHQPAQRSLFHLLRSSAAVWAIAGFVASVFTFANISGVPLNEAGTAAFWSQFSFFSTGIELGQAWTTTIAAAVLVTVWASLTHSPGHAAALAGVSALALIPLAQQGHAAGSASHNLAVVSILMHVLFASIWVGGLVALVWLRRTLPGHLFPVVLRRYSAIAFAAFVAVALSGLVSATIRITDPATLTTSSYGLIVLGKVVVLVLVGVLAAVFRTWLLPHIHTGRTRLFWAMAAVEVTFMGVASGLAGVLARTAPPGAEQEIYETGPVTAAESLTGSLFPEPPSWVTVFQGQPDPFWLLLILFSAATYLLATRAQRRAGTPWPWHRSAAFLAGLLVVLWVTCGPLSIYATYLLSSYVVTIVALLLAGACIAQGRPGNLARATLRLREDGTRGPREWATSLLRRPLGLFDDSPLGVGLVVLVTVVLAMIPAGMRWAVTEPLGRVVVLTAVVVAGAVMGSALRRALTDHRAADIALIGGLAACALASTAVTLFGPTVMLDWFKTMNPGGHPAADADQRLGSVILLISAAATALTAAVLALRALTGPRAATPSIALEDSRS